MSVKILQHNCRGARANYHELLVFLSEEKPDVVCLNETFLRADTDFHIPGYTIVDRLERATGSGGSLVAVRERLPFRDVNQACDDNGAGHLERITATLTIGSVSVTIANVYASPRYPLTAVQL